MIIFLYGEDYFRSLQKLKEIIARYKDLHKTGLNLKFFDFKINSFEDFKDQFQTKSMFKEKRLFVLKDAFSNLQFKQKFEKQKKCFLSSQNVILFHEKKNISEEDSFFLFLKKEAKCQKFKYLNSKELEGWIKTESARLKLEIDKSAIMLLIEYIGNDLWRLSNELQKLTDYKWNSTKIEITKEDIRKLVRQKIETNIFKTIDFIAKKEKEKAVSLIKKHLQKGDSPLYLLTMINFQFRNYFLLKSLVKKI